MRFNALSIARYGARRRYGLAGRFMNGSRHYYKRFASSLSSERQNLPNLKRILEKQNPQELSHEERNLLHALRDMNPHQPETLHRLRDCYESLGYWEYALETELQLEDSNSSASSLQRQGSFHMRLHQPATAGKLLQKAMALEPDNPKILTSWAAWHYHSRDDCTTALQHLQTAAELCQAQNNTEQWIVCLQHQGLMWREVGDYRKALEKYQEALAMMDPNDSEDITHYRSLRLDCADMHNGLEEWDAACTLYESLLNDTETHEDTDPAVRAVLLHNLGKLYTQRKDKALVPQARASLQESIAIKQRLGSSPGELAKTFNALGTLEALHNQDKAVALAHFQESLLLVKSQGGEEENSLLMYALRNIAVLKGQKVAKWQDDVVLPTGKEQ